MDILKKEIPDCRQQVIELRKRTGMNRKEFCEYFQIPYTTMTDWEHDNRHAPRYVLRLLEYYILMEELKKDSVELREKAEAETNGGSDYERI